MKIVWSLPMVILPLFIYSLLFLNHETALYHFLNSFSLQILLILAALNILALFMLRKIEEYGYHLLKLALFCKLVLIPLYLILFLLGVGGIIGMVAFPFSFVITFAVIVIDIILLVLPSLYSTVGIISFYRKHGLKSGGFLAVTQWIYVIDIFALLILFFLMRNKLKLSTQQNMRQEKE